MILLIEDKINEIPILQVVKAENESQSLPTLVYYHGFYGEKISSLTLAYKIANLGYRVILPDALYHGDRKHHISDVDLDLSFWEIVTNNVNEFKVIKDYYIEHQLSDPQRFGVGGTSMGGITTYALLSVYPEIKAAAVLMGTAYAEDYAQKLIDEFNRLNEKQISQKEANDAIHLIR